MNTRHDEPGNDSTWSADHEAVWREAVADSGGNPVAVMLRHPGYPFTGSLPRSGGFDELRAFAGRYLQRVQVRAGIGDDVLSALTGIDDRPEFGWLPVTWGPGLLEGARHARGSFRMARDEVGPGHLLVMLAGYRMKDGSGAGGEVGLRLALHVDAGADDRWALRITGLATSRLPRSFAASRALEPMSAQLLERITTLSGGLGYDTLAMDGMAYVDPALDDRLRVYLSCGRLASDGTTLRNFRVVAEVSATGAQLLQRSERIAHALAAVFEQDPASAPPGPAPIETRRPTRPAAVLNAQRVITTRMRATLSEPGGVFEVRQTPLGNVKANPQLPQVITPYSLPLRSDALAAAQAYLRGDELLRRLQAYGLNAQHYFKLAALPLRLRHRAPLAGARDGIAVNAQVLPDGVGAGIYPPLAPAAPAGAMPALDLSFGWAELAHRRALPNDGGRMRAQPLGLAADPRWAWHEFCHVLNFANLGELEFPFAHSAGDALAAIVADPQAQQVRQGAERGITFPWAPTTRRHDREALRGWCWCGRRNLARLPRAAANAPRAARLGYFEEQLLSSSLFRLYRSLGGDDGTLAARQSASDYAVYLVMGAIQFLGLQQVAPAYTPDQFVWALIETDLAAGAWNIAATWPEATPPRQVRRVGGCVHKVIRWAFERQGLYATQQATTTVEGPGLPPAVDVYIADQRPGDPGGYEPVPLTAASPQPPLWHAGDAGIDRVPGQLQLRVHVRNRGRQTAAAVTVRCWVLRADSTHVDDPTAWTELTAVAGTQPAPVSPGTALPTSFPFDLPTGGAALQGLYWVKAAASCAADPSNLDPAAALQLSGKVPITDLIANDNNLGLRRMNL